MTLDVSEVNFLTVILGGVIYMVIGAVWYSPLLFGNMWLRFIGKKAEDIQAHPTDYLYAFAAALVMAFMLALFAAAVGADDLIEGAEVGVLAWLGFVAASNLVYSIFEGPPYKVWGLFIAYELVSMMIIGAIVTL